MDSSNIITNYAKSSKHVCLFSTISICLIFIFIFSPLNRFIMTSIFGKLIVLVILSYTLFQNINITNYFSQKIDTHLKNNNNYNTIRANITCSYVFSVFLFILIISVLANLLHFI